jgi:hypothetical protein
MSFLSLALRRGAACCVLLAAGCGDDAGPDAAAGTGARVVLGTGREAFEEIPDGGAVTLIQGIQGAYHVWTSFLAFGFEGDVVHMDLATRWGMSDESLLEMGGSIAVRPTTGPTGDPAMVSLGWPALVFEGPCANGETLQVDITVADMSGHSARDHRGWIVDVAEELRAGDCGG